PGGSIDLSSVNSEPITGIGVVASRSGAPAEYCVVAQTTDGFNADLWKDSLFKSKVTRFLCFTRASSPENVSKRNKSFTTNKLIF
uniref:MABP domain-containing protein n=1 Tax=Denticeps clupeoides TaxID=299321 RepID=A0AAY4EUD9_9TELE